MKINKKLLYISELNIPNDSASTIATLKMCSSFSKIVKTDLFLLSNSSNFLNIKKNYLLDSYFKIMPLFNNAKKTNLIIRLLMLRKILQYIKTQKYDYIFTRSVFISTFLSILKYQNILEFHHPNTGFTKYFFLFYKKFFKNKFQSFILINNNINKVLKLPRNKYKVLDTCIDLKNFNVKKQTKKKSCIYTGSLYKGKGFEIICGLAKILKDVDFYVYGNTNFIDKDLYKLNLKNLKIFPYQKYKNIPKIIKNHKICLMPYSKKVYIRSSSITAENFMSPIKLFEYLASERILIASRMKVYNNILRDGFNCYLVSSNNLNRWANKIKYIFKNYSKLGKIKSNGLKTAAKFNVDERAMKIIKIFEKKIDKV